MAEDSEIFVNNKVDLTEILNTYLKHWKWFLLCAIAAIILATLYIRYATPEYAAKAKIQIVDDKNSSSELSAFQDLNIFGGAKNKVEDEIEILNSRSNFIDVVKKLNLNLRVTSLGNVKDSEVYDERPFMVNFIENDSVIHNSEFTFFIELSSDTNFGYSLERDSPVKMFSFGKTIPTDIGGIVITPNIPHFKKYKGSKLKVSVQPIFRVAEGYQMKIIVGVADELSNIININLMTRSRPKP